jgi:hypothetical protein
MSTLASTLYPLSATLPLWQATPWLTNYFKQEPPYAVGDDLGTCYASFAAVVLTAMVLGTESSVVLAGVTCYPAPYVAAVCISMRRGGLWSHRDVLSLREFLDTRPSDWRSLPSAINNAMESIWKVVESPEARVAMNSLRRLCTSSASAS